MNDLTERKRAARKAAFARRKSAHARDIGACAWLLSSVLAGYRGVSLAGYMPIRTEIDPRPAMAEAAGYGPVGVPVIAAEGHPLRFSKWYPEGALKEGPFGAKIPIDDDFFEPELVIVPLVAFDRNGGGWVMAVDFMTARSRCYAQSDLLLPLGLPIARSRQITCHWRQPTNLWIKS